MKRTFRINYHTKWGESLWLSGSIKALGNWDTTTSFPLTYIGNGEWEATLSFKNNKHFEYKYFIKTPENSCIWEGGANRAFSCNNDLVIQTRDYWRPYTDYESVFFTKVFTNALMKPKADKILNKPTPKQAILFRLRAPRVPSNMKMGITGNTKSLGNWKKPTLMYNHDFPFWEVAIDIQQTKFPIEYKYVITDPKTKRIIEWEEGSGRQIFYIDQKQDNIIHIQNDEKFRYASPQWKGAGVAIPVFSLRTEDSFGIGEFLDLKKMVDWCCKTGLKMIQLLPINETVATHSWMDSYPYKAITVLALHPMYLNLEAMGRLDDEKLNDEFELAKEVLNSKHYVDYVEVNRLKSRYYKLLFDQNWNKVKRTKAFKDFYNNNKDWLEPYAAFCFLRDKFKTSNFRKWGEWSKYNPANIEKLISPKAKIHEHIAVHYFIQFYLDRQLTDAVNYAHEQGVALKGDIPIGVSPNSIETWTEPELFNLSGQAGAPPDDFAILGQNWGFPTYNWEIMENDGFAWWNKRMTMMAKYFDAYRIDHILGFFRIWEIPFDAIQGLLGYFKPALPLRTDEIMERGIWFDYDRFVSPYIRGHFLHEFFGEHTIEVRKEYLVETEYNVFKLKEEFNTQRKIFNHFTPNGTDEEKLPEKDIMIRDGLMSLLNEVLFIRDPYTTHASAYHPRISLHYTFSYRELDSETKAKLDELYIDFFYKRHEQFWKEQALAKLPQIISAGNMLVCGEDLGMVPDTVPEVMHELNILSLEIQRMPKNPKIEFGHPADAPYMSVCTTSTHDMTTIRGWWEENKEKTNRFHHNILGKNGEAPFYAEPEICREILLQHLYSPAMWTIFPIQDLLAINSDLRWDKTDEERINVPSNQRNKWRYRMIIPLDNLINAQAFNEELTKIIKKSNRNQIV